VSLTYAIPDIHGRYDLLKRALAGIDAHCRVEGCTIVTLGDYVDRGPDSAQVMEWLINPNLARFCLRPLKGNHEAMMWEACSGFAEPSWWLRNGGDQTLRSYGAVDGDDIRVVPKRHLDWIVGLGLMHVDRHRVFVHAAVDPTLPLDQQSENTLLWKRYRPGANLGHGARHVVHGHHATVAAPLAQSRRTNLDGLAWQTGRLVVGVFEDKRPGGAIDYLEIMN